MLIAVYQIVMVPNLCVYKANKKTWQTKLYTGCVSKNLTLYKNACQKSKHLESDILYSYFSDSCLLTKTKLKMETFKMNYLWVLNLFPILVFFYCQNSGRQTFADAPCLIVCRFIYIQTFQFSSSPDRSSTALSQSYVSLYIGKVGGHVSCLL